MKFTMSPWSRSEQRRRAKRAVVASVIKDWRDVWSMICPPNKSNSFMQSKLKIKHDLTTTPTKSQQQQQPLTTPTASSGGKPSASSITVGPDQKQVFYSVTYEDGKTQQYMMLCPKEMDQDTLIQTLVKQISADPNAKGKKTIRIQKPASTQGTPGLGTLT